MRNRHTNHRLARMLREHRLSLSLKTLALEARREGDLHRAAIAELWRVDIVRRRLRRRAKYRRLREQLFAHIREVYCAS